jgi:uncharacterized protein (DUF433 family)
MQLEEYFDFQSPDDIRIRGTRVGIENVLYEYIHREQRPEKIVERFPSVTLEQVYATILYYLHNRETVSAYVADWLEYCLDTEKKYDRHPPALVERMKRLKEAEREAEAARQAAEADQTTAEAA